MHSSRTRRMASNGHFAPKTPQPRHSAQDRAKPCHFRCRCRRSSRSEPGLSNLARCGLTCRSWKSANCFRRNRFPAANAARAYRQDRQPTEVHEGGARMWEAGSQSGEEDRQARHECSGSPVAETLRSLVQASDLVSAERNYEPRCRRVTAGLRHPQRSPPCGRSLSGGFRGDQRCPTVDTGKRGSLCTPGPRDSGAVKQPKRFSRGMERLGRMGPRTIHQRTHLRSPAKAERRT